MTQDELQKEYLKSLLAVTDEDKKSVLLYVAFDLAVVSLTVSQKIFQVAEEHSQLVAFGLVLLFISAALFFNYYRQIHLSSFGLAKTILTLDVKKAEAMTGAVWRKYKALYIVGYVIRVIGLLILLFSYVSSIK